MNKEKGENLKQRFASSGSAEDAEFALEHEPMSEGRRKSQVKNEHRRKDIHAKTKELREE